MQQVGPRKSMRCCLQGVIAVALASVDALALVQQQTPQLL